MNVVLHKDFKKKYYKYKSLQKRIDERLVLFRRDPFNQLLNNHALIGKFQGYRSINITSDYRAIFRLLNTETAIFVDIDTHSNLYK